MTACESTDQQLFDICRGPELTGTRFFFADFPYDIDLKKIFCFLRPAGVAFFCYISLKIRFFIVITVQMNRGLSSEKPLFKDFCDYSKLRPLGVAENDLKTKYDNERKEKV